MQRTHWCFTAYDLPKEDGAGFTVPDAHKDFKYCVYQPEICPDTGTLHYQGYVELKRTNTLGQVKLMFNDNTMHLEPRRGTREDARAYCMKEDSRMPGTEPIEFGEWTGKGQGRRDDLNAAKQIILDTPTWPQVMLNPELTSVVARNFRWAQEVHAARHFTMPKPDIELLPWQQEVFEHLQGEPTNRLIIWIWSNQTGTGKTTFCSYVSSQLDVIQGSDYVNTLYVYNSQKVIWFDRTRDESTSFKSGDGFYNMLEKFSNFQAHMSTKYVPKQKYIRVHVVVTANCAPNTYLLPGRFRIYELRQQLSE